MKRTHKLTDQQKIDIVNIYNSNNISCVDLAKIYNLRPSSIRTMLIRRGIKIKPMESHTRKYSINENYFNVIDTEEKAYFLGLMYADGYNYNNKRLTISLQEEDLYILEKFKKCINYGGPIRNFFITKRDKTKSYHNSLSIRGIKLAEQISKLGCFPCKSLTLNFPTEEQVSEKFLKHFIRGMMDGDGSIITPLGGKHKYHGCTLTSTVMFCEKLKNYVKKHFDIHCTIIFCNKNTKTTTRRLIISGRKQAKRFLDWIYVDANIELLLKRKYEKYLQF